MNFPTPNPVQQLVFTGGGQDILGNDIESWDDPVPVWVIAYQPSQVESTSGYISKVESDVDMAVPPDGTVLEGGAFLPVTVRDRFVLPGWGDLPFEVKAIEDANHGFDPTFRPGCIVKLKRVTGGG